MASAAPSAQACDAPVLDRPMPARRLVNRHSEALPTAAARNRRSSAEFRTLAQDRSLWVDTCAQAYYVEQTAPATGQSTTTTSGGDPATSTAVADAFALESRPGASRTIFLDFDGGTVSGTAWNANNTGGRPIVVRPYTIDNDPTTFTTTELNQITKAWQVVAADYAAFDVNVTTRDPGAAAIDRTDSSDQQYGAHVMVSDDNAIYNSCGCGGVAYIGVFSMSGSSHLYYQPAWVFLSGVGTSGKTIGEAAAHEVGHNFGLNHDGTTSSGYYSGAEPWAPIMGAGYYEPVSQWSIGEYSGANNHQDDVAVIASGAPVVADDHGDTSGSATVLGANPVSGLISTRDDVDAFSFEAAGQTTVTVDVPAMSDLDTRLRIKDASGATVARVNPPVAYVSSASANGLGARWSATLPSSAGTYTAFVDGVGHGDPASPGGYSDYASLGRYTISLTTQHYVLGATAARMPDAQVGAAYDAPTVVVTGGTAPYTYSVTGAPAGTSVDAATGHLVGTPAEAGDVTATVTVTDAASESVDVPVGLHVAPAGATLVEVADQAKTFVLGRAVTSPLTAGGGDGTYTWTALTAPPHGLTLNPDGTLSGTPDTLGSYAFIAAASSGGQSAQGTISVTVEPPPLKFRTRKHLPRTRRGRDYAATVKVRGGLPRFGWRKVHGTLPRGLSFHFGKRRSRIVGTPKRAGRYHFTLRVRDTEGQIVKRTFRLRVRR